MSDMPAGAVGRAAPAQFSVTETLRDGRSVEIRAFQPTDRAGLMTAVGDRSSDSALRSRFFTVRRRFSEREIDKFMDVDFVKQVALVVVANREKAPEIVGAARYITTEDGTAEVALALIDEYHGLGIGSALVRHLIAIASRAGLKALEAHVLSDNTAMLKVFRNCGLPLETHRDRDVVHLTLALGRQPAGGPSSASIQQGNLSS